LAAPRIWRCDRGRGKAIEIDPDFADAYAARSAACGSKEDDDQAIADASKAIVLDPLNALPYSNRGLARAHKKKGKDLDGAIADVTRAVEIDPNNVHSCVSRGTIYKQAREPGLCRLRHRDRDRAR
jgi:tetratricopeptide (TPR) repeat protein